MNSNNVVRPIPAVNNFVVASSRDENPVATMLGLASSCRNVRSSSYPITKRSRPASLLRTCITAYCMWEELFRIFIPALCPRSATDRISRRMKKKHDSRQTTTDLHLPVSCSWQALSRELD